MTEPVTFTNEELAAAQSQMDFSGEMTLINSKTVLTTIEHTKGGLNWIGLEHLNIKPGLSPRIRDKKYEEHLQVIADSILSEGLYEDKPLTCVAVYEGKTPTIYVIDGHIRMEAIAIANSKGADITKAPVVLKDRATAMEDITVAQARSAESQRFRPLELAIIVKRMSKYGWSEQTIAAKVGITPQYVSTLLTACSATAPIRKFMETNEVPLAVAVEAIRKHGDDATQVLQKAVSQAKERGGQGITRKHLPEQVYKKTLTKKLPTMVELLTKVHATDVFAKLPEDLREQISSLLAEVTVAAAANSAGAKDVGAEGQGTAEEGAAQEPGTNLEPTAAGPQAAATATETETE